MLMVTCIAVVASMGIASLIGSRGISIGVLLGWQLAVTPLVLNISVLGVTRELLLTAATDRVRPFSGDGGGGGDAARLARRGDLRARGVGGRAACRGLLAHRDPRRLTLARCYGDRAPRCSRGRRPTSSPPATPFTRTGASRFVIGAVAELAEVVVAPRPDRPVRLDRKGVQPAGADLDDIRHGRDLHRRYPADARAVADLAEAVLAPRPDGAVGLERHAVVGARRPPGRRR